jgi:hypothetical protein
MACGKPMRFALLKNRGRLFGLFLIAGLVFLLSPFAAHADQAVDLALVLASDVSRSVGEDEFKLQREGYARAFTHPLVLKAIQAGEHRAIAVTFVEWSGAYDQKIVVDWTVIRDGESGAVFASQILTQPRSFAGLTAIGAAINFAIDRFGDGNFTAARKVIDISGDGTSNAGDPVTAARDAALDHGITINGLAILNLHPNPGYLAHTQPPGGLPNYYRQNVIGGPGAFLVEIEDFKSFGEAIVKKLIGEIATAPKTDGHILAGR